MFCAMACRATRARNNEGRPAFQPWKESGCHDTLVTFTAAAKFYTIPGRMALSPQTLHNGYSVCSLSTVPGTLVTPGNTGMGKPLSLASES